MRLLYAIALCGIISSYALGEPKCSHCGKAIEADYIQYLNHDYHQNCFLQVVPKCNICRKPIVDEYVEDYWGNRYHAQHQGECEKCTYCSRLISKNSTNGGNKTSDGRYICNICFKNIPDSDRDIKAIIDDVKSYLYRHGIDVDMTDIPVQLVSRTSLGKLGVKGGITKEMGLAHYNYKTRNGVVIEQEFTIYALDYLPQIVFEGVLAHEMMHVWAYQNCDLELSKALSEGSANYASFLIYSRCETKMAQYMIDNLRKDDDPNYGAGFRRVERYVEKNGIAKLLNYMKHNSKLP